MRTLRWAVVLGVLGMVVGACSSSTSTGAADASACPGAQPGEGDSCTQVPDGTRCVFGDGCSPSTVALVCSGGRWARGAVTLRCDGG